MNRVDFDDCAREARRRIEQMDVVDGIADRSPGAILAALECGLLNPETGAQFDAFVMLQDLNVSIQKGAHS